MLLLLVLCQSNAPELLSLSSESCGLVSHSTSSGIACGVLWLCKGNAPELPFWLWKCDSTVFVSFPFLVLYCPPVYIYCSGLGVSPQSHSLHCRLVASLFSLLIESHSLHCSPLGALSLKGPLSHVFNNISHLSGVPWFCSGPWVPARC